MIMFQDNGDDGEGEGSDGLEHLDHHHYHSIDRSTSKSMEHDQNGIEYLVCLSTKSISEIKFVQSEMRKKKKRNVLLLKWKRTNI